VQDAVARSIARTAAEVLGRRGDVHGGTTVSDEAIGAYLWFERGFKGHDELVSLINHTRRVLDERDPSRATQLSFDLGLV
jgi:hypothetical protein